MDIFDNMSATKVNLQGDMIKVNVIRRFTSSECPAIYQFLPSTL